MKRQRLVLALIVCVVAGISIGLFWPRKSEPKYRGKTLTEWIVINDRATGAESVHKSSYNPSALQESEYAVRQIGTNALPWLIKWLQSVPSRTKWRLRAADTLDKLPGQLWDREPIDSWLDDPGWKQNGVAWWGFHILGSNANSAVPELTQLANDRGTPEVAGRALSALAGVGEAGLPVLLDILSDPTHPNRRDAAWLIGRAKLGTNADAAVRLLSECVSDSNLSTARTAAESLGTLKIQPDVSVPALAKGLQDSRREVRAWCAISLGQFGVEARPAVPALTACLSDSYGNVRDCATNALRKIAPDELERVTSKVVNRNETTVRHD